LTGTWVCLEFLTRLSLFISVAVGIVAVAVSRLFVSVSVFVAGILRIRIHGDGYEFGDGKTPDGQGRSPCETTPTATTRY
jgi:hypothetical protein